MNEFRMKPLAAAVIGAMLATSGAVAVVQASNSTNPCAAKQPLLLAAACNPCAVKKKGCNPCNPCAAKKCNPCNPCAAKKCNPCNPCAAKKCNPCNPCAAKKCNPCNPCAAKKCNPCNPCAVKKKGCNPCNPCNPCGAKKVSKSDFLRSGGKVSPVLRADLVSYGKQLWEDKSLSSNGLACGTCHAGGAAFSASFAKAYPHRVAMPHQMAGVKSVSAEEMVQFCMLVPMASKALPWNSRELASLAAYTVSLQKSFNPCAAKKAGGCNPCNPCAAKKCNPCNPCAAKKCNPCNPCSAKKCNPCNPCAVKKKGCNPCNPCAVKKKGCNPCNPCAVKKTT